MARSLSSFRSSATEFSSLLKYVRHGMASSYSGYTTGTFLKAKKRQNNSPAGAQPPKEACFSSLCTLLKSQISCLLPLFAASPPFWPSKATVLLSPVALGAEEEICGLEPGLSSTASFHKCLGVGCSEDEVSRARTAWDVSCCFPSLYNCPGIPPAPGSPAAMAGKGAVSIYPSQFSAEAEGRVQQ